MQNFRTYNLAVEFYQDCQSLKLRHPFKDQFDRASLSLVLNLAEGSAKPTARDRAKFYSIAMGSLREMQAILGLKSEIDRLKKLDTVAACLYRLIQSTAAGG